MQSFPEELRVFACTLHFYSPNAYAYVRKMFMNILPHPVTIRRWLSSIDDNPGISEQVLNHVSELCKKAETENKQLVFNLVTDEMSIRKFVDKDFTGYIDVGINCKIDTDNLPLATNALVFMLVSINSYFKAPIAYYFVTALTGDEKHNILKDILCRAHEKKIMIVNVTFDGASSNIAMVEKFGVDLKNMKSYFLHPESNDTITVTLDACHMVKLVRNTLADKEILIDQNNEEIKWKYIVSLVECQEKEGLHAATKLRRKHVNFFNEKMKVRLAAQVFSRSVADALTFCEEDLKHPEFNGASGTARFCRVINDVFDLLNSRNLYSKCKTQEAITLQNIIDLKKKSVEYINYISNLRIGSVAILQTKRKTGFLGLIICIKSVLQLGEDLFFKKYVSFLLTFKLSQDHLETFFSCIRRLGGFNNNPTAKQFKTALKKLLARANVNISLSSNCIPSTDTVLLVETDVSKEKTKNNEYAICDSFIWNVEHDYSLKLANFSEYTEDVLGYIAGFVVKKLLVKIRCELCLKSLVAEECHSKLQRRKAWGSLTNASQDVINICKVGEKVLRMHKSKLQRKNIFEYLIIQSLILLNINDLFLSSEHAFDQSPLFDHRNQLIRLILKIFLNLRLRFEASSINDKIERIRSKHTKLVLFKNQ